MLARGEQSLEHLAEADLAYLAMVRTKVSLHHQTAGALATSEAGQALADSWQKLIMLRLKSQKLQLRQQAQPMHLTDMQRVESELISETKRIASRLQQQLQRLTYGTPFHPPSPVESLRADSPAHTEGVSAAGLLVDASPRLPAGADAVALLLCSSSSTRSLSPRRTGWAVDLQRLRNPARESELKVSPPVGGTLSQDAAAGTLRVARSSSPWTLDARSYDAGDLLTSPSHHRGGRGPTAASANSVGSLARAFGRAPARRRIVGSGAYTRAGSIAGDGCGCDAACPLSYGQRALLRSLPFEN